MIRDEIVNLQGRDLDAAVAEKLFGWTKIQVIQIRGVCELEGQTFDCLMGKPPEKMYEDPVPHFADGDDTLLIFGEMTRRGWSYYVSQTSDRGTWVDFWKETGDPVKPTDGADYLTSGVGVDDLGEAVCKAALLALLDAGELK